MRSVILIILFLFLHFSCYCQLSAGDDSYLIGSSGTFNHSNGADNFYLEGNYFASKGEYQRALNAYSEAIKRDSTFVEAYQNRGYLKYVIQDFQGAISDFDKMYTLNPYSYASYELRGMARFKLRDFRGAVDDYTKVIDSSMINDVYLYNKRGEANYYLGEYNGAIRDANRVIRVLGAGKNVKAVAYRFRGLAEVGLSNRTVGCLDLVKAKKLGDHLASDIEDMFCK